MTITLCISVCNRQFTFYHEEKWKCFFFQIIESSDQNTTDSSNQQKETKKSTNKVNFL